jgi:hypothetical protein
MVAQVAAADLILTTIGRVAVKPLAGYLAKNGGKKFAQQYGPKAFEAVLGTTVGLKAYKETEEYLSEYLNHIDEGGEEGSFVPKGSMLGTDRMTQMDAAMAVPNVNESVRETGQGLVIGGEAKEILPPPEPFSTPIDSQTATILSTPIPEKVDTTLSTPIPEKIDTKESFPDQSGELNKPIVYNEDDVSDQTDKLVRGIGDNNPPSSIEEESTKDLNIKTKTKDYKGPITEPKNLDENLAKFIEKYAGSPEDISQSSKMPQSHKKKIYIQLTEYLNNNYPSELTEKEVDSAEDALFYITSAVYDIYTTKDFTIPPNIIMAQDDKGMPLAAADITSYPEGKINFYPKRKENKRVQTDPAIYIETLGSLNTDATSNIVDQIERLAEIQDIRYIVAEDLTSFGAAKALERRGFVPAKKGFFEGEIINLAAWRGGKKGVKAINMVLDLGEKYKTTTKEIEEEFIKEQTDSLLKKK